MEKTPQEMAAEIKSTIANLTNELEAVKAKATATPDEVKAANDALEAFKNENAESLKGFVKADEFENLKNDLLSVKSQLEDAETEVASLKEKGRGEEVKTLKSAITDVVKENKAAIIKSVASKGNDVDMVVKTNTFVSSIVGNTNSLRLSEIEQLAHRKISLLDVFPTTIVPADSSGTIDYVDWDEATSVRAAAALAEGEVFPESTAQWKQESIKMKKIGDTIPISEEFGKDEASMVSEVEEFLAVNVMLEEESQIYNGDGTGSNLEGFYTSSPTYVPVNSGIQDASIYDLAIKVSEDISRGKKSRFAPDTVVMNISTINDFLLKKDADNNYIRPPFFSDANGSYMIGNLRVIESNLVDDNTMVVFDSRKGRIFSGDEYTLSAGYVDDQFGKDLATLKARKRCTLLVKVSNRPGFRKVEDITLALTTLAS